MSQKQPNYIVFLTDDQGYGDLSCMGATDFCTPRLDDLAARGARFTDWYSNSPVCSPSRASLLSGRYPGNAGVRSILAGHRTATGLPQSVPSLATALGEQGYRTGMVGKWHLGLAEGSRPQDHGFQDWFGFMAGCIDYYSHIFYWGMAGKPGTAQTHDLWDNGREVYRNGEYFTDMIADRAVDFVRKSATDDRPFFLYVPFNAPHYPMHADQKYVDRFPHLAPDRRIMAAMLSAVDDAVGAVCDELVRQGEFDNTCIFFQSDNGPSREVRNWMDGREDPYYGGSAGKLRGHKFSLFDGGMRSPALMCWPDRIPAGQVIEGVGAAMDIFPTFLQAAGADTSSYELDGSDVLPMIADGAPSPHAEADVYWEMGKQLAVRRGRYKLVLRGQEVEGCPPEDEVFLADLSTDMGERHNLASQLPDLVADMRLAVETWHAGIEARWEREFLPRAPGTTALPSR